MSSLQRNLHLALLVPLVWLSFGLCAQEPPAAPTLRPNDKADVLFIASAPGAEKDEKEKPALASLDPVAFLVGGKFRDCATSHPAPGEDNVPKATFQTLNRIYSSGRHYPLWWGGAPWGDAETVHSCIEGSDGDYLDLDGCFRLRPDNAHPAPSKEFKGTVWTGRLVSSNHPALHTKASPDERRVFLQAASTAFATHHVPVLPSSIHSGTILKIQLQADKTALAGSLLVQLASTKPKTYYSYRIFMVIEEEKGIYVPVLDHFHRVTIPVESITNPPKPGEVLSEEGYGDKEIFIDNFPLFPDEPDAIITEHSYYESWAYSVYRRVGPNYQLIYTGCGGGT